MKTLVVRKFIRNLFMLSSNLFFLLWTLLLLSANPLQKPSKDTVSNTQLDHVSKHITKTSKHAFVTLHESHGIGLLNLESAQFENEMMLDFPSIILGSLSDGKTVFIADVEKKYLYKLDFLTGNLKQLAAPEEIPQQLVVLPENDLGYAIYPNNREIVCLNFQTDSYASWLSLEEQPDCIAFAKASKELFIAVNQSGKILRANLENSTIAPFMLLEEPIQALKISADEKSLFTFPKEGSRFQTIDLCSLQSKTTDYSCPNQELIKKQGKKVAYFEHKNSLVIAEEEGFKVWNVDLNTHHLQPAAQFKHPIRSVEFVHDLKLITFTANGTTAGETTHFDASATKVDKEGTIYFEWDFGDGQTALSESPWVDYRYAQPGDYLVTLIVKQETTRQLAAATSGISKSTSSFVKIGQSHSLLSVHSADMKNDFKKLNIDEDLKKNPKQKILSDNLLGLVSTITNLSSNIPSSTFGQTITLTATITPTVGPTGIVTFFDGATQIGTGTVTSGVATLNIASLNVANSPHSITAAYSGDVNYDPSVSPPIFQVVNQATPTVSVTSSLNPSNYGDSVTFTSTVGPQFSITPTGTVQFYDNGNPIGTPQTLNGSGVASVTLTTLTGGTHVITAVYNGNANYTAATGTLTPNQSVGQGATTTKLVFMSQSPTQYGQQFNLQAIIEGPATSPALSPSGNVTFYACTTFPTSCVPLGTSTITPVANSNTSTVNFTFTSFLDGTYLNTGTYTLYAVYSGDINYSASQSTNVTHNIVQTSTQSSISSFTNNCGGPLPTFNNISLQIAVVSVAPGAGIPQGNVIFYNGFNVLDTIPLDSTGSATLTTSLSIGKHLISSIYQGNSNYTQSSAPIQTVITSMESSNTALTLDSGTNPSSLGSTLTFKAEVTKGCALDSGAPVPTGTVTFRAGTNIIGTETLDGTGVALLTLCNLYPNTYTITASYSGDSYYQPSTGSLSQTVTGTINTTTTIIASSENPVAICPDTTTLTARVTSDASICIGLVVNGGTVSFYNGEELLGTGTVSNGIANVTIPCFDFPGTYQITAVYSNGGGTVPFNTSTSAPYSQCVTPYDTETVLTVEANNQESGTYTLTATVTVLPPVDQETYPFPPLVDMTGNVTFYNGLNQLGSIPVPSGNNVTFTVSLVVNCLSCSTVSAVYSGENCQNFDTSRDIQIIDLIPSNTTVSVLGESPYYTCQPITFQAEVTGPTCAGFTNTCYPTGVVTFFDGNYSIGSAVIEDNGIATLVVNSLPIGNHAVSATYVGDGNYNSSSSSTTADLTVVKPTTTTIFNILPAPATGSIYGQNMLFGVTVTSSSGITPTSGSVSFSDENGIFAIVKLDVLGKADFSTPIMNAGTHTYTATYDPDCCAVGDGCYEGSSATISNYVIRKVLPNVSLTATPQTLTYGDVIALSASVTSYSVGVPTGNVTFYVGSTLLGTAPIVENMANLRVSNYLSRVDIPVGGNVIFTAVYNGDDNFLQTNANSLSETINKAPVTVALYSESPNPSFFGKSITLTATVRSLLNIPTNSGNVPVGIPPTGTIVFVVDGNSQAPVTLVNGIATLSLSNLTVGTPHTIVARYSGDIHFLTNNSLTYTQQVQRVGTTITATSTPNPSTYNASVPLTINVASLVSGQGTPTGTVTVNYGQLPATTVTLSGGQAIATLSNLPVGSDIVTVSYSGDTNFSSSSTVYTQVVNPAATTITEAINPASPVYGQDVTLNTTVTSTAGTPTGTVTFSEGTQTLGIARLSTSPSIVLHHLSVGPHTIIATYAAQGNYAASGTTLNFTVSQAQTTTAVQTFEQNNVYGRTMTFRATVLPQSPSSGFPTGTVTFFNGSTAIGTSTLSKGGTATFSTNANTLNVANSPYSITATFNGDTNFVTSSSNLNPITQNVLPSTTLLNVASSNNPAIVGTPITLTVGVSAVNNQQSIVAGGRIDIYDGSNTSPIATGMLTTNPVMITLPSLTVGDHPLTIKYTDNVDSNLTIANAYFDQLVIGASTSTDLTSSSNPSVYGQPIILTATVNNTSPFVGTPTGSVSFFDGDVLIGTANLSLINSQASIMVSNLSQGTHNIVAKYSGDTNFNPSNSEPLSLIQQVGKANTTTTIQSLEPSSAFGNTVTFKAMVIPNAPGGGIPTGTVTFMNGSTALGTATVSSSGLATFSTNALPASTTPYTITATYGGDTNFNTSSSGSIAQTIFPTATMIGVTSSSNPAVIGTPINLTVSVSSINHVPIPNGGTVYVYNGTTLLAMGNLNNGVSSIALPNTPPNNLGVGSNSLTITYIDTVDSNFASSNAYFDQIMIRGTTTTTYTSSPNPSTYGEGVLFTATVTNTTSSFTGAPTGEVNFVENGMVVGSGILTPTGANISQTSIIVYNLPVGTQPISAQYTGDRNLGSSSSLTSNQQINQTPTSTTITINTPNVSQFNDAVTFVAVTVPNPTPSPNSIVNKITGTVSFYDGSVSPLNLLGTVPTNGIAMLVYKDLSVGIHQIIAEYNDDTNYLASTSSSVIQDVRNTSQTFTTQTTITANPNPSKFGCPVTFTVTVKSVVSPSPAPSLPTGIVSLYLGTIPLTPVGIPIDPVTGEATFTVPISGMAPLPAGNLQIVAIYSGDDYYSASTSTYNQVVSPIPVSINLTSTVNPSIVTQNVTFNAQLTAISTCTSPIPTGSVSFYDGPILLGTSQINADGLVSLTTNDLSRGNHTIRAVYNPDPNFIATAQTLQQIVNCIQTQTVVLNSYPNPATEGTETLFFVSVSPIPNQNTTIETGAPSGLVTLFDTINGVGPTIIETLPLSNGLAIFDISNLTRGTHSITADFSGSTNFCPSSLMAPGYQQVISIPVLPTQITLTSSLNPAEYGQKVVLTATVTDPSQGGTPTGTVTFFDGNEAIGTGILVNGVATFESSNLAIGDHPITAVYSGDDNYNTAVSSIYNQVIISSTFPLAPHDFKGCQVINEYLNFNERVNILTWQPPQEDGKIVRYEIYRDPELTKLAGVVKKKCSYSFEDRNRKKGRVYNYYLVSVNREGKKSPAVHTRVVPINKENKKQSN